MRNFEY